MATLEDLQNIKLEDILDYYICTKCKLLTTDVEYTNQAFYILCICQKCHAELTAKLESEKYENRYQHLEDWIKTNNI